MALINTVSSLYVLFLTVLVEHTLLILRGSGGWKKKKKRVDILRKDHNRDNNTFPNRYALSVISTSNLFFSFSKRMPLA